MSFLLAMQENRNPRWLSFVGTSGTGKTYLAEQIFQWAKKQRHMMQHPNLCCPVLKRFWPKLLKDLRDGQYWLIDDLAEANFLFLDEVVIEHDPTGFAKDKLAELLSRRCGHWTVITSNLDMERIHSLDGRIASRMIRGGSEVAEVNTIDFAMRDTI